MGPDRELRFRRLVDDDLPLLHRWLNAPAVAAWWEGRDVSWPAVARDYGRASDTYIEFFLACEAEEPVGFIQVYWAKDAEDGETFHWSPHLDLERGGAIDYLLGDSVARGRGLGATMIRAFVEKVALADHPEWDWIAAGPFEANVPSCRALEKAGFTRLARLGDEDGPCSLMVFRRPDARSGSGGSAGSMG